jgi:hypothetical protein
LLGRRLLLSAFGYSGVISFAICLICSLVHFIVFKIALVPSLHFALQFGYVVLFSLVNPVVPTLGLLSCLIMQGRAEPVFRRIRSLFATVPWVPGGDACCGTGGLHRLLASRRPSIANKRYTVKS